MFEIVHGPPVGTWCSLRMKGAEFNGSGQFASLARKVCGLGKASDAATEYKTTADYAKAQDTGRRAGSDVTIQAAE